MTYHPFMRSLSRGISLPAIAIAIAIAIALALAACQTLQPLPGASAPALWQKRFQALNCWNPRSGHHLRSAEPLVAAMLTVCQRMPVKREGSGWETLVILDARRDEVKAVPVTSIYSGGLHFTSQGDVVWYSSGKSGEATRTQKYVEAYALRNGESEERLLGRIEVPFLTGPGIGHVEGEGCRLVWFQSYLADEKSPRVQQMFLVNDDEPFESAKRVSDVGRALFWDPLRRHFVIQKEPVRVLGLSRSVPLDRKALDCSGKMRDLDAELDRRLALVTDENAHYSISRQGDLAVGWELAGNQEPEIIVFHGDRVHRIASRRSYASCPDMGCEPFFAPLFAGPWSSSGDHLMVDTGFASVEVYRVADMQVVKRWVMKDAGDFPVHGFLNDHAAYQFNAHSRMSFQTW